MSSDDGGRIWQKRIRHKRRRSAGCTKARATFHGNSPAMLNLVRFGAMVERAASKRQRSRWRDGLVGHAG